MKRRLVTAQEVLSLHYRGVRCLEIPPDALITPGARDLLTALNFRIQHAPAACAPAGGPGEDATPGDALADSVRALVREIAPGLSPDQRELVVRAVRAALGNQTGGGAVTDGSARHD